jgi:hypothetical protein
VTGATGRVALVTGSSSGIGAATARLLAAWPRGGCVSWTSWMRWTVPAMIGPTLGLSAQLRR